MFKVIRWGFLLLKEFVFKIISKTRFLVIFTRNPKDIIQDILKIITN
ncbi:hypothetical protein C8P67_1066 [Flavobacterium aquicola]|uniref:Uncharacterized protein n=1 Tax=Flavobacterium aquicola TaxID=1682742 RepID=A0A3E0EMP2_9FLAO|nr:hypothetical protein C8P67_1066 [Flavobacterium aquicola]